MNLHFVTEAFLMGARLDNRHFAPGEIGNTPAIRQAEQRLEYARILRAERAADEPAEQATAGIAARVRNVLSRA